MGYCIIHIYEVVPRRNCLSINAKAKVHSRVFLNTMFSTIPLYLIGSYYLPSTFITSLCLSLFYYRLVRFHRIKAPDFSSLPLASYSKFCLHFQCTFRPNIYISRIFNVLSLDAELYILASSLVRLLQCNIFKNSAPKPRKSEDVSQNFFHVFVYLWDMLYSIQPCAYM